MPKLQWHLFLIIKKKRCNWFALLGCKLEDQLDLLEDALENKFGIDD